ncbi:hypothetical protein V6N11_039917 [Hibiscus sabdariffa]|uniref:WRKY domain-containing protein n=1 Tax=Hibiscus sabdariffa TaxID=183260 RepID=A0ABR2RFW9_9ROSI
MFIVTYTAKHNHPSPTHHNSLASSTRQKHLNAEIVTTDDSIKLSPAKSVSDSSLTASMDEELAIQSSTKVESIEDLVEDDFGISDTTLLSSEPFRNHPGTLLLICSYLPYVSKVILCGHGRNRKSEAAMATATATARPGNWDAMVGSRMGPGIGLQVWGTV